MTNTTPVIRDGMLTVPDARPIEAIAVGSHEWWSWLHDPAHRCFRFVHPRGCFTARRQIIKTGCYWYASRKQQGILHKTYLGKAQDLTLTRLETAALVLQQKEQDREDLAPAPSGPALVPSTRASSPPCKRTARSWALPLLLTKMHRPRLPAHLLSRPHLIERLAAGRGKHMVDSLQRPSSFASFSYD